MTPEELKQWRKAGELAAQALTYGMKLIKKGSSILEVSEAVDKKIVEIGGQPAWPTQISCDHIAAHFTSDAEDQTKFENQIASIDVGVSIDGYIGDTAGTVDLSGEHKELVKAVQKALDEAVKTVRVGVQVSEIGRAIQNAITSFGLSPVKNLSGHGISRWIIHDKPTVPNFDNGDKTTLQKGQIIAIEPFATNGVGMVEESEQANIFSFIQKKPARNPFAREILSYIEQNHPKLPFTTRWLAKKFGAGKTNLAVRELVKLGVLEPHAPLVEKAKGKVSVFEKTVLVDEKPEVLTKYDY